MKKILVINLILMLCCVGCYNENFLFYYNTHDAIVIENNRWYSITREDTPYEYDVCHNNGPYDIIKIIKCNNKKTVFAIIEYYELGLEIRPICFNQIDTLSIKNKRIIIEEFAFLHKYNPKMIYDCNY
jgi:hypothetical protein